MDAEQLGVRNEIAKEQLASKTESMRAQLAVQQSAVDQARALLRSRHASRERAEGARRPRRACCSWCRWKSASRSRPGANLARVANPSRLKAEIKIAETQAKDIQIGQKAEIDTRNGVVRGPRRAHRSVGAERHAHG